MFKKSIIIVVIQVLGLVVGFLSIYIVAGDMAPEIYSLVGVYAIINSIVLVFSNLGIETTMMREALYWIHNNDTEKVKEYATQAIVSRFLGFLFLSPFVLGYLLFLCYVKYDISYLLLFISFFVGSCISALNDSISLIIRSQGDFVFAQFAQTLNNNVMKFVAIIVFVLFGDQAYLYFFALYSIPLLLIFTSRLRRLFSLKHFVLRDTIIKVKEARFLFLRSYLDFFRSYADSIIVSVLFPIGIMGSYTLFKNFENLVKNLEDGFFDVLSQNMVSSKGDIEALRKQERIYNLARFIVLILIVFAILVFATNPGFFIELLNLTQYEGIVAIVYCTAAVAFLYLIGKYENSALSLFATSRFNFKFGLIAFFISILTYVVVICMPNLDGVLLQRVLLYLFISLAGIFAFYNNKSFLFSNVLK